MGIAHQTAAAIGHTLENVRAGEGKLASRKLGLAPPTLEVTSSAFIDDAHLPMSCTADSASAPTPPPLRWTGIPPQTRSIAIVCEDPDAPFPQPFVHWLVYGLEPSATAIHDAMSLGVEGKNSKLATGFTGASPPPGHGVHRYHFQVFALDTDVALAAGAGRSALIERMKNHVLGWGEIVGTYQRK